MALWEAAVIRSRGSTAELLSRGGFEQPAAVSYPDGSVPNIRRFLIDLIEEYSRHTGHADLIPRIRGRRRWRGPPRGHGFRGGPVARWDAVGAEAVALADPCVSAGGRCARRAAPARPALAPPGGVGGTAGQHAASGVALDPCARRGDEIDDVGGPVARPAVGTEVQRVRRRGERPRDLLARAAAGRRGRAAPRDRRRRPGREGARPEEEARVRGCRGRPRGERELAALRRDDRPPGDPVGGRAPADLVGRAAARDRARGRASGAGAPLPPRVRSVDAVVLRDVGRDRTSRRGGGVRCARPVPDPGPHPDRQRVDPRAGRAGVRRRARPGGAGALAPERRHLLPVAGRRPRAPGAGRDAPR